MNWPWPYINDGYLHLPDPGGTRSFIGFPLWWAVAVLAIFCTGIVVVLLAMSSNRREENP